MADVSGNDERRARAVVDALVMEHEDLFLTSPEFHAGVVLLSRTLPRFMDLMADEARQVEAIRKTLIDNLNTQVGPPMAGPRETGPQHDA